VSTLAVYDCMLFFSAAARPSRIQMLFELVKSRTVSLCLSPDVLAEIRDVLTRPKLMRKYPALTKDAVDAFLSDHLRAVRWFNDVTEQFILKRDPKDSKYLNLAIAARAPFIVTLDRDLLDLMNPQSTEGQDFRTRYPDIQILIPAAFLAAINTNQSNSSNGPS
jgi:putative PIN family toxin of toxin-antitoxin system